MSVSFKEVLMSWVGLVWPICALMATLSAKEGSVRFGFTSGLYNCDPKCAHINMHYLHSLPEKQAEKLRFWSMLIGR